MNLLKLRQNLPLDTKIEMTKRRIREFYNQLGGNVYLSFSGGKDSTVLKHIVDNMHDCYNNIPLVFADTGLQFPEIKEFVYSFVDNKSEYEEITKYGYTQKYYDNLVVLKPKIPFNKVIEKYGYPVVSKEQSQYIYEYRNTDSEKLKKKRIGKNKSSSYSISGKWKFLINAPFKISHKCCDVMKKRPFRRYEKETGNSPIVGLMAENSFNRRSSYVRDGCNILDKENKRSRPIIFWTEQDILEYIYINKVKIADVYGEVKKGRSSYYTTGRNNTGCIFCMFGIHMEKKPNRFQKLKETHPKLWKYCMNKLGLKEVLEYMDIPYE